ncbi:MAG: DUF881 domain-containing protein [Clostridia bacterium]|nr:DUF881 domain-containing protein [Clostridia bacterium]
MNRKQKITSILLMMLTLLLVFQYKVFQNSAKYVGLSDIARLQSELTKAKAEVDVLREQVNEKEGAVSLLADASEEDSLEDLLYETKSTLELVSGLTAVTGEGVIVLVTDGERELLANENPNNLMVHDVDIRNIVDDLRNSGAEAISINGQRIVFGETKIYCTGPTVKINDDVFSQPFIIKAIGDRYFLEASVNAPGQYGYILKQWGIFVEVNTSVNIEIPAYTGTRDLLYAEEVKESE